MSEEKTHIKIDRYRRDYIQLYQDPLESNGVFYFSTDNDIEKYKNETNLFTNPNNGYMSIDENEHIWVANNGFVRRFDSDGNKVAEGEIDGRASWGSIQMRKPVMMANGGTACVYTVVEGFSSTFYLAAWDKDGNRLWTTSENEPADTVNYWAWNVTSDRNNNLYAAYEFNHFGEPLHQWGVLRKYNHETGAMINEVGLADDLQYTQLAKGMAVNKDNTHFFITGKTNPSGSSTQIFKVETATLSLVASTALTTDIMQLTAMDINEDDLLYIGLGSKVYTLQPDLTGLTEFVDTGTGLTVDSIHIDTFGRIYVLSEWTSGGGVFEGRCFRFQKDGTQDFMVKNAGRARNVVTHPGKLGILK